ncbi:unnamed protein product [Prunus brigantina]
MNMFFPRLFLHSLMVVCFANFAFGTTRLPLDEVQTLADIAKTLGKKNWDFSGDADPCINQKPWTDPNPDRDLSMASPVILRDRSFVKLQLRFETLFCDEVQSYENSEFVRNTPKRDGQAHLSRRNVSTDLSRNYLSGTIPPEWGSLPLINITLIANRLTGPIPKEIGNITTLKSLDITMNNFSGVLPRQLGNLPLIEQMLLTSNNFTGELPDTFGDLTTLKNFRVGDSHFSGQIPDFIKNWTNLEILRIQASGLTGPIPFNISLLTKLTDLRITDLSGPEESFPPLEKMKDMKRLMLRSCNIVGQLPPYLGDLKKLKTLDLSFNKLTGEIPSNFVAIAQADYIFLTGNLLTGPVPTWTQNNVDLSYNNFTIGDTGCQLQGGLNLFASSSQGNSSKTVSCFRTAKCPKKPVTPASGESGISVGAVVGIVAAGVFIILLTFGILWRTGLLGQQNTLEDDLKGVDLQTGKFSFRQLKDATNNFDKANKIGEGGFGSVYKGLLSDGTVIAVKQLSSKSKQGNREFLNEIGMISALQHPHLVKLHGCCIEGNQLLLVYEYMENNSLARALFGKLHLVHADGQLKLDWPTRHKICVGIARGLAYLHEESRLKVVHRDIKATNVLLDKNLTPKISDFGLAKLDEEDNTHISTRIAGTYGYMAPEYAMRGYLTDKADVYSFGILVLEIASGRNNTTYRGKGKSFYLLDWAQLLKVQGNLMDLVDPRLGSDFNKEEMMLTINVALLCCNVTSTVRPTMSSVVSMLEGRAAVEELVSDPNASTDEMEAMRKHFEPSFGRKTGESQTQTASTEGPWTGSSTSAHDLYPVNPDSTYWDNRNERN